MLVFFYIREEEEREKALRLKVEEEERIREENKRIKEWEDKFDQEQKKKEDELIRKFYSDKTEPIEQNDSQSENNKDGDKNI